MKRYFLRRAVFEWTFPDVVWTGPEIGNCECPGAEFHEKIGSYAQLDIRALTISCPEEKCSAVRANSVAAALKRIRPFESRRLDSLSPNHPISEKQRKFLNEQIQLIKIAKSGAGTLAAILNTPVDEKEWISRSPTKIPDDLRTHWRLILQLVEPNHRAWLGERHQSGKRFHIKHFGDVALWMTVPKCPAPYISPAIFKGFSFGRNANSVIWSEFFIVHSEKLSNENFGAVIAWLSKEFDLVAIVSDATRLYAWFLQPRQEKCHDAKKWIALLLSMECDASFFRGAQITPLPGWICPARRHKLLYLDFSLRRARLEEREKRRIGIKPTVTLPTQH